MVTHAELSRNGILHPPTGPYIPSKGMCFAPFPLHLLEPLKELEGMRCGFSAYQLLQRFQKAPRPDRFGDKRTEPGLIRLLADPV